MGEMPTDLPTQIYRPVMPVNRENADRFTDSNLPTGKAGKWEIRPGKFTDSDFWCR